MYGIDVDSSDNQFEKGVRDCSFCGHENSSNAKFCDECNGPLDSIASEQTGQKVRKQEGQIQEILQFIKEEHPKAIADFYEKEENVKELQKLGEPKAETGLRVIFC